MPVTPRFSLSQDDQFLYVEINVPYVRVTDMDFTVLECDFTFYCKPYLLKLSFPGPLVDDERAKGVFDIEKVRIWAAWRRIGSRLPLLHYSIGLLCAFGFLLLYIILLAFGSFLHNLSIFVVLLGLGVLYGRTYLDLP